MLRAREARGLLAACAVLLLGSQGESGARAPAGRLVVSVLPNPALCRGPDESLHVYVQAVDPQGVPLAATPAGQPSLVVTLTSSDRTIVEPYGGDGHLARIDVASSYGRGVFVSGQAATCGTTAITASAEGFEPVTATVTTVPRGGEPAAIKLFAFPPRLPVKGREIQVRAQVVDAEGTPTYLKSNRSMRVEGMPATAFVIRSRDVLFYDSFTSIGFGVSINETPGEVTLTATLTGLRSEPVRLTVEPPPGAATTATPVTADVDARPLAAAYYEQALRDVVRATDTGDWDALAAAGIAAEAATDLQPDRADHWVLLGHIYRQLPGSVSRAMAEDAFARAVAVDPQHLVARMVLGQLKFDDGYYASALEHFEFIARQKPREIAPALVAMMNVAYLQDGLQTQGAAFWRTCLAAAADADAVRIALAILLNDQKDPAARGELDKVAERPGVSIAHRDYARTLLQAWAREGGR